MSTSANAVTGTARRNGLRWLWLSLAVVLLDQLTKFWITDNFVPYERVTLLPVLDITLMFNRGAAFSMLANASGWQHWLFTGLALVISVGILIALRRLDAGVQLTLAAGLALVLGGAVGNVVDRLRLGHVVDFIHAHWNESYFPAFNVADSAITIGAGLLLIDAWLEGRRGRRAGAGKAEGR